MEESTKAQIREYLSTAMQSFIERLHTEQYNREYFDRTNPFGVRLVPVEVWRAQKFERSFVTKLGKSVFERVAKIIAKGTGAIAENQHVSSFTICTWRAEWIDSLLESQRKKGGPAPNWQKEVSELLSLQNDRYKEVKVTSDLFVQRPDGTKEFYCIKTVMPNLDQTEKAKRDALLLTAGEQGKAYFALPSNPAGEGNKYKKAFTIPFQLFDMDHDECVLIGSAFWNKLSGSPDTYQDLLGIFAEVGNNYLPIIRQKYLG